MEQVLQAGSLLHQVGRNLRAAVDAELAAYGVTSQQAALLLHVGRGMASPRALADGLGTDTAGMTRLLDRLEAKGLLRRRRHPDDRRSVLIELTDQGGALLPRLAPVFGRVNRRLLTGFSAAEVADVTAMLRRMTGNLPAARP